MGSNPRCRCAAMRGLGATIPNCVPPAPRSSLSAIPDSPLERLAVPGGYVCVWRLRERFTCESSAVVMRVCQPRPVERKNSITSGSSRTLTCTLWTAAFGRPRSTGRSSLSSLALSSDVSGSRAIPALMARSSRAVGLISLRLLLIVTNLASVRLAQADDAKHCTAPDEDDAIKTAINQRVANLPRLAIVAAPIGLGKRPSPVEPCGSPSETPCLSRLAPSLAASNSILTAFIVSTITVSVNAAGAWERRHERLILLDPAIPAARRPASSVRWLR